MKRARRPRQMIRLVPDGHSPAGGLVAMHSAPPADLFEAITNRIVDAITSGNVDRWKPGHTGRWAPSRIMHNPVTGADYKWRSTAAVATARADTWGWPTNLWATRDQWATVGAQVPDAAASLVSDRWICEACGADYDDPCGQQGHFSTEHTVHLFNAAQVDGYDIAPHMVANPVATIPHVEQFVAATGADISCTSRPISPTAPRISPITI